MTLYCLHVWLELIVLWWRRSFLCSYGISSTHSPLLFPHCIPHIMNHRRNSEKRKYEHKRNQLSSHTCYHGRSLIKLEWCLSLTLQTEQKRGLEAAYIMKRKTINHKEGFVTLALDTTPLCISVMEKINQSDAPLPDFLQAELQETVFICVIFSCTASLRKTCSQNVRGVKCSLVNLRFFYHFHYYCPH